MLYYIENNLIGYYLYENILWVNWVFVTKGAHL